MDKEKKKSALIVFFVAKSGLAQGQNSANGRQWIRNVNNLVSVLWLADGLGRKGTQTSGKKVMNEVSSVGGPGRAHTQGKTFDRGVSD